MTATTATTWEAVIGLEVHVELATATKLFCSCKNKFGAEPNTNICPVCLGLPGSLPVLGERAVEFALRVGEALQCTVPDRALQRLADAQRELHRPLAEHGQRSGQSEAHGADVRVGLGAELVLARAEQLRGSRQLDVHLQADH